MLLSKTAIVRWNGIIKKWYTEKGYIWTKQNDLFECNIKDLQQNSTAKIIVKCDYCGAIFEKEYRKYLKSHAYINKDCCNDRKCMVKKSKEVNIVKYGVDNHMKTNKSKEIFSSNNRIDFKIIQELFNNKNLTLLSKKEDYINNKSILKFICNNHRDKGVQETTFNNIKRIKSCCQYGGIELTANNKRLDGKLVYNEFIKNGLIPKFKSNDYIKNDQQLPFICKKHIDKGVQYRQYNNLKYSTGCIYCARERASNKMKLNQDLIFAYFDKRGLKICENEIYKGKDEKLKYKCKKHNKYEQYITYNGLKKTKIPCLYCREENNIRKLKETLRSSLGFWIKYSKNKCNNKCILSGATNNLEVHHQYQFENIVKDCLKKLNIEIKQEYNSEEIVAIKQEIKKLHNSIPIGVCLHEDLHTLFHSEYGKINCTKELFNDFVKRYFNREFDDELKYELKSINSKTNYKEALRISFLYINK